MPAANISARAIDDLDALYDYIGLHSGSPAIADRFMSELHQKLEAYAHQPEMGEPRADLDDDLRSFTFKRNYVVIYRPVPGGIDVLRVLHGARDYVRWFHRDQT